MTFQALNHANTLIPQEVLGAFADQPKLRDQIAAFIGMESNIQIQRGNDMPLTTDMIIAQNPYSTPVFQNISTYVLSLKRSLTSSQDVNNVAPASKKRKLDVPTSVNGISDCQVWADKATRAVHAMPDVSFSVPVRKKMRLEWVPGGLRAVNNEGEIDFGVAWVDIGQLATFFSLFRD
jgi:hypothetical protein